ncbi:MAG TPA: hypothetical protein VKV40_08365 [Ktedonobacteraceae bacterium]|nr:hypothetical protein [Ktedonobacteraceae bacterium]
MYYRVAIRTNNDSLWKWKSTPLSSLTALFSFLRLHKAIPQDRLRVFTASSCEEINEMLVQENSGQAGYSVSAAQFLSERGLSSLRRQQGSTSGEQERQMRRPTTSTLPPLVQNRTPEPVAVESRLSALERRRVELEMGAGGDHDQLYVFTLPVSVPQMLAWARLLARVQQGEMIS